MTLTTEEHYRLVMSISAAIYCHMADRHLCQQEYLMTVMSIGQTLSTAAVKRVLMSDTTRDRAEIDLRVDGMHMQMAFLVQDVLEDFGVCCDVEVPEDE